MLLEYGAEDRVEAPGLTDAAVKHLDNYLARPCIKTLEFMGLEADEGMAGGISVRLNHGRLLLSELSYNVRCLECDGWLICL